MVQIQLMSRQIMDTLPCNHVAHLGGVPLPAVQLLQGSQRLGSAVLGGVQHCGLQGLEQSRKLQQGRHTGAAHM